MIFQIKAASEQNLGFNPGFGSIRLDLFRPPSCRHITLPP